MKVLSLFLVLQLLVLQTAPALAFLPAADCCSTSCEEGPTQPFTEDAESAASTGECCNPFGCVGCCVLVLPASAAPLEGENAAATGTAFRDIFEAPAQKSHHSIWHPPRKV